MTGEDLAADRKQEAGGHGDTQAAAAHLQIAAVCELSMGDDRGIVDAVGENLRLHRLESAPTRTRKGNPKLLRAGLLLLAYF